jgi:geranylgeranylglycerol-phosphate geranylgeranyltransferase
MMQKIESFLRDSAVNVVSWLAGFSGILLVRFFLESISSPTYSGVGATDAPTLLHYYLFFLVSAFVLMLFFWFALPSWRGILPQFSVLAFTVVILGPLVDFVLSGGSGFRMAYMFEMPTKLVSPLFTFFGSSFQSGITLGMRLEFLLILLGTFWLLCKKGKSLIKALLWTLLLYLIIFSLVSLPSIVSIGSGNGPTAFLMDSVVRSASFANNLHGTLLYGYAGRAFEIGFNFLMGKILFLLAFTLMCSWFYLSAKEKLVAVVKNSRPERVIAYFISVALGVLLANLLYPPLYFNWTDWLSVIVLLLAFYLSWVFAVCVNDIVDEDIDAVSNADRPLIQRILTTEDLRYSALISLVASLLAGYLSGYYAFFSILAFTALYYVYSAPPTRFKRIPFFATFLIGLCNLSAFVAGYFFLSADKDLRALPAGAIVLVTLFYSLLPNIRDLKDIEGDKKAGIKTVPVLFGKKVTGILSGSAYLLVPFLTGIYWLHALSIPACYLTYRFSIRKSYVERPLFAIYFVFVALCLALVFVAYSFH